MDEDRRRRRDFAQIRLKYDRGRRRPPRPRPRVLKSNEESQRAVYSGHCVCLPSFFAIRPLMSVVNVVSVVSVVSVASEGNARGGAKAAEKPLLRRHDPLLALHAVSLGGRGHEMTPKKPSHGEAGPRQPAAICRRRVKKRARAVVLLLRRALHRLSRGVGQLRRRARRAESQASPSSPTTMPCVASNV